MVASPVTPLRPGQVGGAQAFVSDLAIGLARVFSTMAKLRRPTLIRDLARPVEARPAKPVLEKAEATE